jgi:hypothetical protein
MRGSWVQREPYSLLVCLFTGVGVGGGRGVGGKLGLNTCAAKSPGTVGTTPI